MAAGEPLKQEALAAQFAGQCLAIRLDVTDAGQRSSMLREALNRFGSIDVLVNNAGIDFLGAIEEQAEADYRRLFEVNFFGAVALTREVLPGMRARGSGTIVNVSSMDGVSSMAANGYYSASKFALEGVTEALWQEIEPLGLRAILVEPGALRTGIDGRTTFSGTEIPAYAATSGAFRAMMLKATPEMFPGDPKAAAAAIYDVVVGTAVRRRVILGSDAYKVIGDKLDAARAEHAAGRAVAFGVDFPAAAAPNLAA